jgi:hypothetical protein
MRSRQIVVATIFGVVGMCAISVAQSPRKQTHLEKAGLPALQADAKDLKHTIITPHLKQVIPKDTNVLWCNTFQLAWNEFCDLAGGPIKMDDAPDMVSILNGRKASKNDLDEASYLAIAGLHSEGVYEKIQKQLQDKFKGQADPRLFDELRKLGGGWVTYAYLFKQLPFRWAFTRFHGELEFSGKQVESFGIWQLLNDQKDEVKMATQVAILDYQSREDFIIELETRERNDRLILAKLSPKETLEETIKAIETRIAGKKPTRMEELTDLKVPVLNFDLKREYSELYPKIIHTGNHKLGDTAFAYAAQYIRFRLDETGAILQSEAGGALSAGEKNLIFDGPFLILLKRREAKNPYFALWVGNAELLVKNSSKQEKTISSSKP